MSKKLKKSLALILSLVTVFSAAFTSLAEVGVEEPVEVTRIGDEPVEIVETVDTVVSDIFRAETPMEISVEEVLECADAGTDALTTNGESALLGGDEISYIERSWDETEKKIIETPREIAATEAKTITESTSVLRGDLYVVQDDVTIPGSITVEGNPTCIILMEGKTLTVNGGIHVGPSNSLAIYGQEGNTGELIAKGGTNEAGIGDNSPDTRKTAGTITIHGGIVTAKGGTNGAGIGGGYSGSSGHKGGTVTVYGGTVTATGGENGAGIGGGYADNGGPKFGAGGTVTIYGGTVTATGGENGAGIGGGYGANGGTVNVYGGTVTATSTTFAGIGAGTSEGEDGELNVYGGSVEAKSTQGYGIGTDIKNILGGKVTAKSDFRGIKPDKTYSLGPNMAFYAGEDEAGAKETTISAYMEKPQKYVRIEPLTIADILPDDFPTEKENGWENENGCRICKAKIQETDGLRVYILEADKYTPGTFFKGVSALTKSGNDFVYYEEANGKITFCMNGDEIKSIKIEDVPTACPEVANGTYKPANQKTIADILGTVKNFPATAESGWVKENGGRMYTSEGNLEIEYDGHRYRVNLTEQVTPSDNNYVINSGSRKYTFVMVNDVLDRVNVTGCEETELNGTYAPAPAPEPTITVTSNKTEYKVGEVIDITIKIDKTLLPKGVILTDGVSFKQGVPIDSDTGEGKFHDTSKTTAGTYTYKAYVDGEPDICDEVTVTVRGSNPQPIQREEHDHHEPLYTGKWNSPVKSGSWSQDANGIWHYISTEKFRNTWGYILNPYAREGQNTADWFWFDIHGNMLTGWQFIGGKWYYLNPFKETGNYGACQLGGVTPDGWTVDESGAWIESIPKK